MTANELARGLDAALREDDDLVAVLRGHLVVEAMLGTVIAMLYPNCGVLLDEMGYGEKVRIARRQGCIDKDRQRALQTLGEIRNSFAHLPIKTALTAEDGEKMLHAMGDGFRGHMGSAPAPGRVVRAAIGVIYAGLILATLDPASP